MRSMVILSSVILMTSCGALKFWEHDDQSSREVAGLGAQLLVPEEAQTISDEIEDKLMGLHSYYVIGQKNLVRFDQELGEHSIEKLYSSEAYLNLLAVRTQTEELEHELDDYYSKLKLSKSAQKARTRLFETKVTEFSMRSDLSHLSMQNLVHLSKIKLPNFKANPVSLSDIQQEYKALEASREFQIYEKNIDHLAHLMEARLESTDRRIYPSAARPGNITGNEFPAKVWSLTFDDGPKKGTSLVVLKNLKEKNLKATFFQLTSKVSQDPETSHAIRDAGMEIASHSYTHKELTKVGTATLEHEINTAVKDLERVQDVKLKFFRLPYGAGVSVPHIRQRIAENNLVHVFWNVDTLDWMAQTPDKIVERTKSLMKKTARDSGVILFHDIHERTTIASAEIMDYLKTENRRVCVLDVIVTQMNEGQETVCPQN